MSMFRRGGFGALACFTNSPRVQVFVGQIILMLQFVVQVKFNPCVRSALERVTKARAPTAWNCACRYIDARLDLADTVLTLVLLLLSATGVLFSYGANIQRRAGPCSARLGSARLGSARLGSARLGSACVQSRHVPVPLGWLLPTGCPARM
jgi:hypothetical protein